MYGGMGMGYGGGGGGGLIADGLMDQAMAGYPMTNAQQQQQTQQTEGEEESFFKKHWLATTLSAAFAMAVVTSFIAYIVVSFSRRSGKNDGKQSSSSSEEEEEDNEESEDDEKRRKKKHKKSGEQQLMPDVPGNLQAGYIRSIIYRAVKLFRRVKVVMDSGKPFNHPEVYAACTSAKVLVRTALVLGSPAVIREITQINVADFQKDVVETLSALQKIK